MKSVILEEKYILEYIRDMLITFKTKSVEVNNAKYHHNCDYINVPNILKYGILSLSELNRLNIKKYSPKTLKLMSDTDSHINGIDDVSLSIVGLKDIRKNEFEYDPYNPLMVDLTISSDIKARRDSTHYGNEYLYKGSIPSDKIKSVDIRLFKLIEKNKSEEKIKDIINKYNCLREIALAIKDSKLDIPFRDMSKDNLTMDVDKVSNTPILILK